MLVTFDLAQSFANCLLTGPAVYMHPYLHNFHGIITYDLALWVHDLDLGLSSVVQYIKIRYCSISGVCLIDS